MATATAIETRTRDSMGRFLPQGAARSPNGKRQRDEHGRFLPKDVKPPKKKKSKAKSGKKSNKSKTNSRKTARQTTHIAIILDDSGSMRGNASKAKTAYNQNCDAIRESLAKDGQEISVSLYTFGEKVKKVYFNRSVDSLQDIRYDPNQCRTALYEAINTAVRDLEQLPDVDNKNTSFLLQIITDGGENKNNITDQAIRSVIQEKQSTDRWTFAISCPQRYQEGIQRKLGIFEGNIQVWDPYSKDGMATVATGQSGGVSRFLGSRTRGQTSTRGYFKVDVNVGRNSLKQTKKGLIAESKDRFRRLTVDKARKIKDFVESKNLVFEKGRVFYQLNKPETIQSYKEIILQERKNPKVFYGGDQVRDRLGIPRGQDGKVSPGNLGEWVIWIQSTSVNRNLLAKMIVLFDKRKVIAKVPFRKH